MEVFKVVAVATSYASSKMEEEFNICALEQVDVEVLHDAQLPDDQSEIEEEAMTQLNNTKNNEHSNEATAHEKNQKQINPNCIIDETICCKTSLNCNDTEIQNNDNQNVRLKLKTKFIYTIHNIAAQNRHYIVL